MPHSVTDCERCKRRGLPTALTSVVISTKYNTTMVFLCADCLRALRTLWGTFMDSRLNERKAR